MDTEAPLEHGEAPDDTIRSWAVDLYRPDSTLIGVKLDDLRPFIARVLAWERSRAEAREAELRGEVERLRDLYRAEADVQNVLDAERAAREKAERDHGYALRMEAEMRSAVYEETARADAAEAAAGRLTEALRDAAQVLVNIRAALAPTVAPTPEPEKRGAWLEGMDDPDAGLFVVDHLPGERIKVRHVGEPPDEPSLDAALQRSLRRSVTVVEPAQPCPECDDFRSSALAEQHVAEALVEQITTLREQYERLKREMATWPQWMRDALPDFRSEDQ
jgi:hypothetical protein